MAKKRNPPPPEPAWLKKFRRGAEDLYSKAVKTVGEWGRRTFGGQGTVEGPARGSAVDLSRTFWDWMSRGIKTRDAYDATGRAESRHGVEMGRHMSMNPHKKMTMRTMRVMHMKDKASSSPTPPPPGMWPQGTPHYFDNPYAPFPGIRSGGRGTMIRPGVGNERQNPTRQKKKKPARRPHGH